MHDLEESLTRSLEHAVASLDQPEAPPVREGIPPAAFRWEIPKDPTFGDLSNAIAFKLAAKLRKPPPAVAQQLAERFPGAARSRGISRWIDRVEPKAGFLNVFLSQDALVAIAQAVLRQQGAYGTVQAGRAPSVNIEFVSANPTGPLSVAHGRQAAVGDILARLLASQGARVTKEYYLNDEGRQIEQLGISVRLRYLELHGRTQPFPEDGYQGLYVVDVAKAFQAQHGARYVDVPEAEALPAFMDFGKTYLLKVIKDDLDRFGLTFDAWTSQAWLRTSGKIDQALKTLTSREALYEADDALWFASTKFGDDKDRVVKKRDGELTYLAPDIAYHEWKAAQGYDQLVNLWGPDHHGYIGRIKAAMAALGLDAGALTVRIVQLVTLTRQGKPVPMSKRQGEFVTFREIMDEVGIDATRFFFMMRTMDSPLDFDLELAKSQSNENPVYYVQYAHARISSILAKDTLPWWVKWRPDLHRLTQPEERLLLRWIFQYPVVLKLCALGYEPHGVTVYLRKLAEAFHVFYTKHRVISEDRRLSAARLLLVRATQQVLANGLGILGVTAPTRM